MRLPLLLSLLLLSACGDPEVRGIFEPDTETPTGPMYTISGVVIDSLSGEVLPGVRVSVGKYGTEADAAGQWSLQAPAGSVSVSASPIGYERSSFTFALRTNAYVTLMARRLAPIVQECVQEGQTVRALVTDLQGRKSVERWQKSEATVLDPSGQYTIAAPIWGYTAVDYLTWAVTLSPVAPGNAIRWHVFDSEGHAYSGTCEPTAAPPGE